MKVNEENMKPSELNFEGNDINSTHCVSLGIKDSEVKMRTGFINEEELLANALMLCDGNLDVFSLPDSKLT